MVFDMTAAKEKAVSSLNILPCQEICQQISSQENGNHLVALMQIFYWFIIIFMPSADPCELLANSNRVYELDQILGRQVAICMHVALPFLFKLRSMLYDILGIGSCSVVWYGMI